MFAFALLIYFKLLATVLSTKDFVPVLIWGTQSLMDSRSFISGLSKLDTDDFFNYLLKKVESEPSNIVLFVEENLSLEDFSWRDVYDQGAYPLLSNMTQSTGDLSFLPSVRNPYKAIRKLVDHGYIWKEYSDEATPILGNEDKNILVVKLTEPDSSQGRPELLRSHDKEIVKTYDNLLLYNSNILGLYTGNHSSWMDSDVHFTRVKRDEQEDYILEEISMSDSILLADGNKTVLMMISTPIVLKNGSEIFNLTSTSSTPTIQKKKNSKEIDLDVNFKYKSVKPEVDFHFNGSELDNWMLSHVIVNENKDQKLFPTIKIEAPRGYSYHCGRSVVFQDQENKVSLTLKNIQIQPYAQEGKFGPAIDCVPYFSIAIWSGLFIVVILTLVLAWGIVMIMDINTMDRFDDAKGKTITISATE